MINSSFLVTRNTTDVNAAVVTILFESLIKSNPISIILVLPNRSALTPPVLNLTTSLS